MDFCLFVKLENSGLNDTTSNTGNESVESQKISKNHRCNFDLEVSPIIVKVQVKDEIRLTFIVFLCNLKEENNM